MVAADRVANILAAGLVERPVGDRCRHRRCGRRRLEAAVLLVVAGEREGDQIEHLPLVELVEQALRHERLGRRGNLLDLRPRDLDELRHVLRIGDDRDLLRRLAHDPPCHHFAVGRLHDARLVLVAHDLARMHDRLDEIPHLEPAACLRHVGPCGPAVITVAVADDAPGGREGTATAVEAAAGRQPLVAGPADERHDALNGPGAARPLRLGQGGRCVGLADAERLERELVVLGEPREAVVLDVDEELAEAVAAGPLAGPAKPFVVALAVGEGPLLLFLHGPQNVREMDLQQVRPVGERRLDRPAVPLVSLDEPPQVVLVRCEIRCTGRAGGGREQTYELRHDPRRPHGHEQARYFPVEVERARRKERCKLRRDLRLGLGWRLAQTDDCELIGPHKFDLSARIETGRIDTAKRLQQGRLCRRLGLVGNADRGGDQAQGLGRRQRLLLPEFDRLVLEGHAGRVAEESVGARKPRQSGGHGGRGIASPHVKSLEFAPEPPLGGTGHIAGIDWCGRFSARVGRAVELALAAPAAHGEVDRAVLPDGHVGQGQRRTRDELLLHALVGGAVRLEVDRVHRAEGPVADVESPLVLLRKLRAVAEGHAHRRSRSDVDQGRQAVGKTGWPLAAAAPPAQFTPAGRMVHSGGPIPRRAKVIFHVGVVDEEFAVGVERHVVGIAVATAPDLPRFAIAVRAHHVAARRENPDGMTVGVPHPRDQLVFVPVGWKTARAIGGQFHPTLRGTDTAKRLRLRDVLDLEGHLRVVAADDDELRAVGGQEDVVRAVLTAAVERAELFDRVERVVLVRVGDAIEPAAWTAVADHIERVERPEQPLGPAHLDRDFSDHGRLRAVERRRGDPHETLVALVAGDETPLRIGRERHP